MEVADHSNADRTASWRPLLDRLSKSAAYFADKLKELFEKPTQLNNSVVTNNKDARTRLKNLSEAIKQAWVTRQALLAEISQEGFSITNYLKIKQLTSSLSTTEKPSATRRQRQADASQPPRRERKPKEPKEEKEKTWEVSYRLYREGRTPEQIAEERSLTVSTIYTHLTRYIARGEIALERFIPEERQQQIREAIAKTEQKNSSTAIKMACPPDITYWEIRMMLTLTPNN